MKRYAVVIEKADGNYSAYVPDLPGCVATGPTVQAIEAEIRDAIRFHIEGRSVPPDTPEFAPLLDDFPPRQDRPPLRVVQLRRAPHGAGRRP